MATSSDHYIQVLEAVEARALTGTALTNLGLELPRGLLERGLVLRDREGNVFLTREGRNMLFRARCLNVLRSAEKGETLVAAAPELRWLQNARFLSPPKADQQGVLHVTARGREWLASAE